MTMSAYPPASHCCSALATLSNLPIFFPNTTTYNAVEASYWSQQEGSLVPSCVVKPTTSTNVVDIIRTLVNAKQDCKFAIKGQGHAPAAGFANIDNGVTIDMADMNGISVNRDHSVASVGAGARWVDVYAFLDPLGKSVAGGRNGQVGVGGLALGGGISYFSPQVGWTCDTVRNFQVVLASGDLINANETANPDLFRALKGGTNNFGVVTRFDFATVPIGEILGGSISNDISYRHELFQAFANIANARSYDVHASIVAGLSFSSSSKNWTLSSTPIYTKPVLRPAVYKELFAIPNITDSMHLTNLSTFSNESAIPQLNFLFATGTYGASAKLLNRIFNVCNSSLYDFQVADDTLAWSLALEPLPRIFVSHGAGQNVLGTSPANGNGMILLLTAIWSSDSVGGDVRRKADELMSRIDAVATRMGLKHELVYANYAGAGQQPFSSYGAANEHFLHKTAKKYDPHGVFQRLVPGGFKLDG